MNSTTVARPWKPHVAAVVGTILLFFAMAVPAAAQRSRAFLLSGHSLITVDLPRPDVLATPIPITGVSATETLVGIDFRPQNEMLYSLGVNAVADTMTLYLVSTRTGVATPVGAGAFTGAGNLPDPTAVPYGVDFDPATDRLRVTTRQSGAGPGVPGLNFRVDPNTGTLVGPDTAINPPPIAIDEVAYATDFQGDTGTKLYTLSALTDSRYVQNPPNGGTQTTPLALTVGGNPLDFTAANGFDISGAGLDKELAVVVLTAGGTTSLYRLFASSQLELLAPINAAAGPVRGLAIQKVRSIDAPPSLPAFALTADGLNVLRFNTANPTAAVTAAINPAGIVAGDVLVGIDIRPQTGQLFALGFNAVNNTIQTYRIDPQTSATTASATAIGGPIALTLVGATAFGVDFNPTVDRIRVVTSAGENLRINPSTGALVMTDTAVNPPSAIISGAAYTNSFAQTLGGTVTTLYTLDATNDQLYIQNPPNAGQQTAGIAVTHLSVPLDFTNVNGFDIPASVQVSTANAPAVGLAYAVLTVGGVSRLYAIELSTGVAALVDAVGDGTLLLSGLALGETSPEATATLLTSSANPATASQSITFTATVLPAAATGSVAFATAMGPIAGCESRPLSTGTATCTTTLPVGSHLVFATYTGDATHVASRVLTGLSQRVDPDPAPIQTRTTLGITPSRAREGDPVQFDVSTFPLGTGTISGTVNIVANGTIIGTAAMASSQATLTISTLPVGDYVVTATYLGQGRFQPSTSAPQLLTIGSPPPLTQYFAEGATGFFHTTVGILNTSATDAANVTVRLLPEFGAPITESFTLNPLARRSLDVNGLVGNDAGGISTVVESTQPIGATRQMTWGDPVYGSTLESGVRRPERNWSFAEGATNIFSLFYLLANPGPTEADVTLTHLLEGGGPPIHQTEVVPPFSRRTLQINAVPGLEGAALSTLVGSNVPILAERAMYLNTTDRQWEGGAAGIGAAEERTEWSFAEGATGFFHTYLLIGNRKLTNANVTILYQFPDGTTLSKDYVVPGLSRRTIDVNGEDPQLASAFVSMKVSSNEAIVVERAMWWGPGIPGAEGSAALGSPDAGTVWAIGEGAEGGASAESTFVLVANSSSNAGTVRFTVVYDDGTQQQKAYPLAGNARLTARIVDDFPNTNGQRFSVLVESLTAGVPITVEYARYQSPFAFADAGGAALATRIR